MKKHWITDDLAIECTSCKVKFDSITRKHHCRFCGLIFCDKCSSSKISVASLGLQKERACTSCASYYQVHLPVLLKERRFVRYQKRGKSTVAVRISDDEKNLVVRSDETGEVDLFEASALVRVCDGIQTPTFASHDAGCCGANKLAADEPLCFSLCFTTGTVDLKASTVLEKTTFYDAAVAYAAMRQHRSATVLDERRDDKKRADEQTTLLERQASREAVKMKYSDLKHSLGEKYT